MASSVRPAGEAARGNALRPSGPALARVGVPLTIAARATAAGDRAPMRPLPPACRWIIRDHEAHLYRHAGCIGFIVRDVDGWKLIIQWGRSQTHPVGSLEQGVRYLTRYIAGRKGWPPIKRKDWRL